MDPVLQAARDKRAKFQAKLDELLTAPTAEARAMTDDEQTAFEELAKKIGKLDRQIVGLTEQAARSAAAAAAQADVPSGGDPGTGGVRVRSEAMTYDIQRVAGQGNSYFRDLAVIAASTREAKYLSESEAAIERLRQHAKEMDVEARHDPVIRRQLHEVMRTPESMMYRDRTEFEQRVNPNTTAGTGGEFVPPLWLVAQYIPLVRPGRVFANRVQNLPLPPGIDIINIPKITVGSQAAIQTANAAAVSSVDIQTATVSAAVRTIAGQEDISMQLLEQSPLAMDNVIFDDLGRDYDQRLDLQVVGGTGAAGQHQGVLSQTANTNNTSITAANAITVGSAVFFDVGTAGTQFRSIVNGVNQIETLRFAPPTGIWVHPRRANSWAYAADSATGRPLFVPTKYGAYNVVGLNESAPGPQGMAGELFGLPVIKDANMSTTCITGSLTTGTGDCIAVLKEDDIYLWEGSMRMRALPEILSGTLQIRFQLYAYSALMANRFPPSVSILTGTVGLAAPAF